MDDDRSLLDAGEPCEDLPALIQAELDPGERLLWAAPIVPRPPEAGRDIRKVIRFVAIIGVLGGACFGTAFVREWSADTQALLVIAGGVPLLIALFTALFTFKARVERREAGREARWTSRLRYALTDRRAILWIPQLHSEGYTVRSIHRGEVDFISRVEYPDGTGDVIFRRSKVGFAVPQESFGRVSEARRVEDLARRILIVPGPDFGS